MAEPTLQDVHVDMALTDFSVARWQDNSNFVATQAFPVRAVSQKSNKYHVLDKASALRSEATKRAPNTESAGRGFTMSQDNYNADVYAVHFDVSEQIRANADASVNIESAAAAQTVQDIQIRMDQDWATAAFSTGIWATESTATWNTSTGDPIGDIATGIETILKNTGYTPNTLVLGAEAWYSGLWQSTAIRGLLPDNAPRVITPQIVANHFGLDRVLIAKSVRNTAVEDSTSDPTMAFNNADHALLAYVDPSPGVFTPTAGVTFVWTGLIGSQNGIRTKRFEIPRIDAYPRVETDTAYDFKVVASDLGYLIKYATTAE